MGTVADSCPPALDPEIAGHLASLPPGTFDFDGWTLERIGARRAARAALPVPEPPPTTTVFGDERVDAAVRARIYSPPDSGPTRPCVYWIHGGGYISGSALTIDPRLNRWVERSASRSRWSTGWRPSIASRLLPVSRADVLAMLQTLRGQALLAGGRGRKPANLDRVTEAIANIVAAATSLRPRLHSIEINPLIADGDQVCVLDALILARDA